MPYHHVFCLVWLLCACTGARRPPILCTPAPARCHMADGPRHREWGSSCQGSFLPVPRPGWDLRAGAGAGQEPAQGRSSRVRLGPRKSLTLKAGGVGWGFLFAFSSTRGCLKRRNDFLKFYAFLTESVPKRWFRPSLPHLYLQIVPCLQP